MRSQLPVCGIKVFFVFVVFFVTVLFVQKLEWMLSSLVVLFLSFSGSLTKQLHHPKYSSALLRLMVTLFVSFHFSLHILFLLDGIYIHSYKVGLLPNADESQFFCCLCWHEFWVSIYFSIPLVILYVTIGGTFDVAILRMKQNTGWFQLQLWRIYIYILLCY